MKTFIVIAAVLCGWATFLISHEGHYGLFLLSWPAGAVLGFLGWFVFHPGARVTRRIEQYRPQAARLRENDPERYRSILEKWGGRETLEPGDAQAYVALWLWAAENPDKRMVELWLWAPEHPAERIVEAKSNRGASIGRLSA